MRGDLLYKCRLCGAVSPGWSVPDLDATLPRVADEEPAPEGWHGRWPGVSTIHSCPDGRRGVADLVGGEPLAPAEGDAGAR